MHAAGEPPTGPTFLALRAANSPDSLTVGHDGGGLATAGGGEAGAQAERARCPQTRGVAMVGTTGCMHPPPSLLRAAWLATAKAAPAAAYSPHRDAAVGILALFAPENGICFATLKRLGPLELRALGASSWHFRRLMDDPTIDPVWARFYGHHFHMTDRDAGEYINLRPKQIFSRLASLSITGKWHVTGRVTQVEQEVENAYGYIQFFTERERLSPIESSFEGEVEDDESVFLVEGRMVGNSVVMYETITSHSNVPIAVNICSGVLSLRGGFMSGVWTQHNPSASRVLSETISSGVFEATKLDDGSMHPGAATFVSMPA